MWDVFIAYSSSDRAFASRFADALGKRLRVFIDINCLRLGDDWDIALRAAVEDAAIVVVLVSPSTQQSFFQRDEILRAVERSRKDPPLTRLIPIFVGGAAPTKMSVPYGLSPKQGIEITNENELDAAAARIIEVAVSPVLADSEDESRQVSPSLRAVFAGLHQDVQQLTQDQYRVIQQLRYLRRVRISGCAGSGKTLVAAEKASRLSVAGLRVLLVCHNPLLAEHIGRLVAGTSAEVADFVSWLSTIAGIPDEVHSCWPRSKRSFRSPIHPVCQRAALSRQSFWLARRARSANLKCSSPRRQQTRCAREQSGSPKKLSMDATIRLRPHESSGPFLAEPLRY